MSNKYDFKNVGTIVSSISLLLENEDDADRFLDEYTDYMLANNSHGWGREECRNVCLKNIGYCAGYIDMAAIRAVNRLMGATHIAYGAG